MKKTRLLVLVAALALWPSAARASWWSWLEELSGPGPFTGGVISVALAWLANGERVNCWDRKKVKQTVVVRFGWFDSGDHPRFRDLPPTDADNRDKVRVFPLSGLYLFRPHRSIDIGPGAGLLLFSGKGFDT